MKHKVTITQVCRVERSVTIEVEAESIEEAVEKQSQEDSPHRNDPRWIIDRDCVENEVCEPG